MSRLSNESKLLMGQISDLKPFTGSGMITAHPWVRAFHIRGKGEEFSFFLPPLFFFLSLFFLLLISFLNRSVGCLKLPLCLEC